MPPERIPPDNRPLYNSRVIKICLEYLNQCYPEIEPQAVFEAAGITAQEVEDPAHWFSQHQTDAFIDWVTKKTGDTDFPRKAGRHYAETVSLGPMKQYTLSLLSMGLVFRAIGKMNGIVSRGAVLHSKRLGPTKMEIIASPAAGVDEKAYQCANRIGVFEAVGKFFCNRFNTVDHPECRYQGDAVCRYIVSWEVTTHQRWKQLRNLSLPLFLLAAALALPLMPAGNWLFLVMALLASATALFFATERIANRELSEIITEQGALAREVMENDRLRYSSAVLFKKLGQAISTVHETDRLVREIASVMAGHLPFDRCAFLVANPEGTRLTYRGGSGYTPSEEGLMASRPVSIGGPGTDDLILKVFHSRKPRMVDGAEGFKDSFLAGQPGGHALIAVPIVYEDQAMGVLMVDNHCPDTPMIQSDVSILAAIASQTAVGIINARSYQQLRVNEARYRLLAENVSDVIWVLDISAMRFTYMSPSVESVLGYTPEEAVRLSLAQTLPPDALAEVEAALAEELGREAEPGISPDRSRTLTVESYRKDGSTTWVEIIARFLRDGIPAPTQILGIARDISERRRSEQEREHLQKRLQRAEKLEALGTLAGGVAHDLNNILSGIVGYPDILLMDLPQNSPQRQGLSAIKKSGQKAAAIVQDLLTLARRSPVEKEVMDLNAVVSDYLDSPEHENLVRDHPGIGFNIALSGEALPVHGSSVHLSKAVMNLVRNAAEAMPAGGSVAIRTRNVYLDTPVNNFETIPEGEFARVRVADDGIGISPRDLQRLFDPFYSKKRVKRSGSGLGTTIIWSTVKDHDGYIDIHSAEGEGTRFDIYLPFTREKIDPGTPSLMLEDYLGDEAVLVVDDVREQREITVKMLGKLGYRATAVSGGEAAVAFLRAQPVDLLVLDMIMPPGIDGLETYRRVVKAHPGQKAVIASGYSESGRVRQTQLLGAGAYLRKPFTLEQIGHAVRTELDRPG